MWSPFCLILYGSTIVEATKVIVVDARRVLSYATDVKVADAAMTWP